MRRAFARVGTARRLVASRLFQLAKINGRLKELRPLSQSRLLSGPNNPSGAQPTVRQRLTATDREHPLVGVMKDSRFHRYFRQDNRAHNGLVGGSSPPGPTMICFGSFDLNALAPKLSSVNTMLDKNLFTIRPRSVSPSPRAPCACGRPPWCNAALLKATHDRGLPRFGLRCIRSQRAAAPPPYARPCADTSKQLAASQRSRNQLLNPGAL